MTQPGLPHGTPRPADTQPSSAHFVARGSDGFPESLLDLTTPPDGLYAIGSLEMLVPPIVTVVGTRDSTAYGERITRELCTALARAGACIASGMARGIDAEAHRTALANGGRTIAVLGTGIDVPYPRGHRELHARIGERGLVLSEFPSGHGAFKGCFPRRNRILAAIASATIVVEAGAKSGAVITAELAGDLGRTVAAVPGPIDAAQSQGANALIRDGAQIITSIDEALTLIGLTARRTTRRDADVGENERAILHALARGPADLDSLAARTALPARECMAAVTALEIAGAVECTLIGEIRLR